MHTYFWHRRCCCAMHAHPTWARRSETVHCVCNCELYLDICVYFVNVPCLGCVPSKGEHVSDTVRSCLFFRLLKVKDIKEHHTHTSSSCWGAESQIQQTHCAAVFLFTLLKDGLLCDIYTYLYFSIADDLRSGRLNTFWHMEVKEVQQDMHISFNSDVLENHNLRQDGLNAKRALCNRVTISCCFDFYCLSALRTKSPACAKKKRIVAQLSSRQA